MKTTLLTVFALVIGMSLSAQKVGMISADKANVTQKATVKPLEADPNTPATNLFRQGDGPRTLGVNEAQVGLTTYDLQSNECIQNRMYVYPDNSIGAVWTQGYNSGASYSDRGTGYNYYNGATGTWGDIPTARLNSETAKTGWPSYAPLGAGEMVISHTSASMLNFTRRATRGEGSWTTSGIPGTTTYAWPRAITSNGVIHLIANTGALYQGLTNAIVYLRSTDNGATWSTPAILPGMDAASFTLTTGFTGFGGDGYAWATPKGDTLAFGFGSVLGGIWVMKSFDNGLTWTRTTVYQFPNFTGGDSPDATTFDETFALALDNEAKIHVVTTRYKIVHYNSTASPVSWNYYPYTDGIVYWNENMPQIDTAIYNNIDSLVSRGMYIGGMLDYNNNGEIEFPTVGTDQVPWGDYRYVGPSGMPQIEIDNNNNMFVSYSACREDLIGTGANPNSQLYKHLYLTSKMSDQATWTDPMDLNDDILHSFDEVVWGSMVNANGNLHFLCQMDPEPGTSIGADLDTPGDNYITYLNFPTFVSVKPVDISKDVTVSPNPATEYANVQVMLSTSGKVEVSVYDIMGKLVVNNNYGQQPTGNHLYKVNTSSLTSGVYIFTVKAAGSQTTKKVIVK